MGVNFIEAGRRFLKSRIVYESDYDYKERIDGRVTELWSEIEASNQVVEELVLRGQSDASTFEWNREHYRNLENFSPIRDLPRKRWFRVLGNIKLRIPSERSL